MEEFFERVDGSWEPYCDKDETMKREKNNCNPLHYHTKSLTNMEAIFG